MRFKIGDIVMLNKRHIDTTRYTTDYEFKYKIKYEIVNFRDDGWFRFNFRKSYAFNPDAFILYKGKIKLYKHILNNGDRN